MSFNPNVVTAVNLYASGADNTGVTACETTLQGLVTLLSSIGGGKIFASRGTYSFPLGGVVWHDNVDLEFEEGAVFNLGDSSTNSLFVGLPNNIRFENVTVQGTWTTTPNDTGNRAVEFTGGSNIKFLNCNFDGMRQMSLTARNATNVSAIGCHVTHSARDSINFEDCTNVVISNNVIQYGGDNGIACSFLSLTPAHTSIIITDNILEDTFGINCLGGKHLVISGNTLKRTKGTAIEVAYESSFAEGATTLVASSITNNHMIDLLNSQYVGGSNVSRYIIITGFAQKGGLAKNVFRPSNNSSAHPVPQPPYGGLSSVSGGSYDYNSGHSSASPTVSGAHGLIISGNTCIRTLQGGVTPSTWGFNTSGIFSTTGWVNTSIASGNLQSTGIVINPEVHHTLVSNNVFMPGLIGILLPADGAADFAYEGLEIYKNKIIDCISGGILTDATTPVVVTIRIEDNTINCDPYFQSTNRVNSGTSNFDGTWSNVSSPAALEISNLTGVQVGGNHFWNCAVPIHATGSLAEYSKTNWQHCNPTATGYNAANAGIGNILLCIPGSVSYVVEDCNPTNTTTYGKILNFAPTQATSGSPPASGSHIQGQVAWVSNPGISGGTKTLNFYYRATTSSANVSGTDWVAGFTTVS